MSYKRSNAVGPEPKPKKFVLVGGKVTRTTDKAILFTQDGAKGIKTETWIPRSQIAGGSKVEVDEESLSVAEWFAKKESLKLPGGPK